jgi:hypothetical protein
MNKDKRDRLRNSGSTLIAAKNSGGICCDVEPDPLCIDGIIRSYAAVTRATAVLADTEEPFATLAARSRNDEGSPAP